MPVGAVVVSVPPQTVADVFVTVKPAGSVSTNPIPLRVLVAFGLLIVKLSEVEPFSGMLAAPNALLIAGGPFTVIEALAVLPAPPSVDVTVTLLLFTPTLVPVTFTESV